MKMKRIALVLGNCLFPDHRLLQPDDGTVFVMIEDYGLCTHYKYHKHKLVLFLSAMRSHSEAIRSQYELKYVSLTDFGPEVSYEQRLETVLEEYPEVTEITTYDIEDHFFEKRLKAFCTERQLQLNQIDSPGFLTSKAEFSNYFQSVKRPFMHTFYQQQRKRLKILVDGNGAPLHGQWSFDADKIGKASGRERGEIPVAAVL